MVWRRSRAASDCQVDGLMPGFIFPSAFVGLAPSTIGTWDDSVAGSRTCGSGAGGTHVGFQFAVATAFELSSVKWDAASVTATRDWVMEVWSDSSGSPSAQQGVDSSSNNVSAGGEYTWTWATPIALSAGTYWILGDPSSDATSICAWDTVSDNASYGSGRHNTETSITDALPSSEDWRVQVNILS